MPHTDSLPILTQELLDEEEARGIHLASWAKISPDASVLGGEPVGNYSIRVWRKGISPKVEEFVQTALEVLGREGVIKIHNYFLPYAKISLDESGRLIGQTHTNRRSGVKNHLTVKAVASLFAHPQISPLLAWSFGEHLLDSLKQALAQMPSGSYIWLDDLPKGEYRIVQEVCENTHGDGFVNLLLQYSHPGTPYSNLNNNPVFVTTAGDVSLHGVHTRHGFATAEPLPDRTPRPRMSLGFRVHYAP